MPVPSAQTPSVEYTDPDIEDERSAADSPTVPIQAMPEDLDGVIDDHNIWRSVQRQHSRRQKTTSYGVWDVLEIPWATASPDRWVGAHHRWRAAPVRDSSVRITPLYGRGEEVRTTSGQRDWERFRSLLARSAPRSPSDTQASSTERIQSSPSPTLSPTQEVLTGSPGRSITSLTARFSEWFSSRKWRFWSRVWDCVGIGCRVGDTRGLQTTRWGGDRTCIVGNDYRSGTLVLLVRDRRGMSFIGRLIDISAPEVCNRCRAKTSMTRVYVSPHSSRSRCLSR